MTSKFISLCLKLFMSSLFYDHSSLVWSYDSWHITLLYSDNSHESDQKFPITCRGILEVDEVKHVVWGRGSSGLWAESHGLEDAESHMNFFFTRLLTQNGLLGLVDYNMTRFKCLSLSEHTQWIYSLNNHKYLWIKSEFIQLISYWDG